MGAAAGRGSRRRWLTGTAAAIAALLVAMLAAAGARAAEVERVYWDNANDGTLGVSNLDASGGGPLDTTGLAIQAPEGMSYDPVTGRLYVADAGSGGATGKIAYVNIDGSGGGTFTPPVSAPVAGPTGVVIDPVTRIAYWLNGGVTPESISWARLDGSEGGTVDVGAAPPSGAVRLALDPAAGRLYWGNGDGSIAFAAVDGSGGRGFTAETNHVISGISYYQATGRLYWVEENENKVSSAAPTDAEPTVVSIGSAAPLETPRGLALDPTLANPRLYWANEAKTTPEGAIGLSGILSGSLGGEISPTGAPVNGPQDPVIVKSPVNTSLPAIAEGRRPLNCSPGSWAPDYVSSFVYQAPTSFSYQWTLNGEPIAGATEASYGAPVSGSYKCVVTASNAAGSTTKTSQGMVVTITLRPRKSASTPAKLVLVGDARKLKAKPGKLLTLGVGMANQGTVASDPAKLCLKLTKKAKRALKAGRCVQLGALAGGATTKAKLRLRVKGRARPGVYKLQITLPESSIEVSVRVIG